MRDEVMGVVRASFRPEFLKPRGRGDPVPSPPEERDGRHRRHPGCGAWRGCSRSARSWSSSPPRAATGSPTRAWDPAYGARSLEARDPEVVQDPLAELILSGAVKDGETVAGDSGAAGPDDRGSTPRARTARRGSSRRAPRCIEQVGEGRSGGGAALRSSRSRFRPRKCCGIRKARYA